MGRLVPGALPRVRRYGTHYSDSNREGSPNCHPDVFRLS